MGIIEKPRRKWDFTAISQKISMVLIWMAVLYSQIIQHKFMMIGNAMLILGVLILSVFLLPHIRVKMNVRKILIKENEWVLVFMVYQLVAGLFMSPDVSAHFSQWFTSIEYLLVMMVISSLIIYTGSESFHWMLLVTAVILAVLFLMNPVSYHGALDRYSISNSVNPNGLGMALTSGMWGALYFEQKKKIPFLVVLGLIALFLCGIFRTGSRKALIAAAMILVLWYFFSYIPGILHNNNQWKIFIFFFSVLIIVVSISMLLQMYVGSDMEVRMLKLRSEAVSGKRQSYYQYGWILFQRSPILGLGLQGFKHYIGIYSHATVVEVPVSGGIIGTILYFVSYYLSIKRCLWIYGCCRRHKSLSTELKEIRMILCMWVTMLFYCVCIIHPYQFESFIMFGIIFGQSAYIENKIQVKLGIVRPIKRIRYKWGNIEQKNKMKLECGDKMKVTSTQEEEDGGYESYQE